MTKENLIDKFIDARNQFINELMLFLQEQEGNEVKCTPTFRDDDGEYDTEVTLKYFDDGNSYFVNVVWITRYNEMVDGDITEFSMDELWSIINTIK